MRNIGKVIKYNGNYGIISCGNIEIEFSKRDLVTNNIGVGDIVEFRIEKRSLGLLIARSVLRINYTN